MNEGRDSGNKDKRERETEGEIKTVKEERKTQGREEERKGNKRRKGMKGVRKEQVVIWMEDK
jgi:hypothetical protein